MIVLSHMPSDVVSTLPWKPVGNVSRVSAEDGGVWNPTLANVWGGCGHWSPSLLIHVRVVVEKMIGLVSTINSHKITNDDVFDASANFGPEVFKFAALVHEEVKALWRPFVLLVYKVLIFFYEWKSSLFFWGWPTKALRTAVLDS